MDRIIVGVDPQPAGQHALDWALHEAVLRRLPLTAVRAWSPPTFGLYYPIGSMLDEHAPAASAQAEQIANDMLKAACERVPGTDTVETSIDALMGVPAEVLVQAAGDTSLLVVGSRGAGVLSRAVLGSVSAAVLHHATCPVVVVPESAQPEVGVGRVLVGVDHSPSSLNALRFAVQLARAHSAPLVPVCVHEPVVQQGAGPDVLSLEAAERQALLTAVEKEGGGSLQVEPEVLTGHAAQALRTAAERRDVVVVGSRGRGGFTGLLLGSTSTQLTQHASCPVVVVRTGSGTGEESR